MSVRDIAFVGCRLIAIYWGLTFLFSISGAIESLIIFYSEEASSLKLGNRFVFYHAISLIINGCLGIGLWFTAGPISRVVFPSTNASSGIEGLATRDIQAALFSAVGLLILLGAVPKVGSAIYADKIIDETFNIAPITTVKEKAHRVQIAIEVALGLFLFFGGRGVSGILLWFREFGMKSKPSDDKKSE